LVLTFAFFLLCCCRFGVFFCPCFFSALPVSSPPFLHCLFFPQPVFLFHRSFPRNLETCATLFFLKFFVLPFGGFKFFPVRRACLGWFYNYPVFKPVNFLVSLLVVPGFLTRPPLVAPVFTGPFLILAVGHFSFGLVRFFP